MKAILRRAKKSKKGFHFIGFDKGLDGLPILYINKKKIPGAATKILRKKAVKKKILQGRLIFRDGRFVFMMKNNNVGKLRRNLKIYFGKLVKMLKNAIVEVPKNNDGDGTGGTQIQITGTGTGTGPQTSTTTPSDTLSITNIFTNKAISGEQQIRSR